MLKLRKDTEDRITNANNEFYFEGSLVAAKAYLKKNSLEFVRYSEYSDTVYYN